MSSAKYNVVDVSITSPSSSKYYKHVVETPVFLGWRRLDITDATETQTSDSGLLLYLEQIERSGNPVSWSLIESKVAMDSKPPPHYTEASLIQRLEDLGIGRPSTFSAIVETIQERGYAKKTNVKGTQQKCIEWKLRPGSSTDDILSNNSVTTSVIETTETVRVFGEEKDKLVIQPTGELVLEFLTKHFDDCFSYGYTKSMEDELDEIASQPSDQALSNWYQICRRCFDDIVERSKPLARQTKQTFSLSDSSEYVLVFNSYGASLKRTMDDGIVEYAKVRADATIELDKAKQGEYTVSELIWREDNGCLGTYQGSPVYLKKGKYGLYAEYGGGDKKETVNLKTIQKTQQNISLSDVTALIKKKCAIPLSESDAAEMFLPTTTEDYDDGIARGYSGAKNAQVNEKVSKAIIRALRPDLSIRKGKYGPYVFHKTTEMSTPAFYPLKPIIKRWQEMADLELITWIEKTYRISI